MKNLKNSKVSLSKKLRHRARRLIIQALYQWYLTNDTIEKIDRQFSEHASMNKVDINYFQQSLHDIMNSFSELDEHFKPLLDRNIEKLNPVELQILRLGCYELTTKDDIPYRVVINEAIELAKEFGAEESHKYVNGVLDKLAQQTRAEEFKQS